MKTKKSPLTKLSGSNQLHLSDQTCVALVYLYIRQKKRTHILLPKMHIKHNSLSTPIDTIWCKSFPPGFRQENKLGFDQN